LTADRKSIERKINMRMKLQRASLMLVVLATLFLCADFARPQDGMTLAKRLRNPATVRGFIGGESHDSYVIHARKGQLLRVQISWRHEEDNNAQFTVSESPDFGEQVEFGKESSKGKRWSGRIPKTGNYYIFVVAHPAAHYKLRVVVR
jgi:hypothetical protein